MQLVAALIILVVVASFIHIALCNDDARVRVEGPNLVFETGVNGSLFVNGDRVLSDDEVDAEIKIIENRMDAQDAILANQVRESLFLIVFFINQIRPVCPHRGDQVPAQGWRTQ